MNRRSLFCVVVSLLSILFVRPSSAQTVPPLDKIQNQQELDSAITALDAALFDASNKCDLDKFASLIDENVEFYHDQGGVTPPSGPHRQRQEKHPTGSPKDGFVFISVY
jgi:Domain of unknown function (DUF4440)